MTAQLEPAVADRLREVVARRRVVRRFRDAPVDRALLEDLATAAYWAPSGGGRKPVKVVAVSDPVRLRHVIAVSPGIIGNPAALLLLCADWSRAPHLEVDDRRDTHSTHVDIGAAMENVLLLAEASGLGSCPVMSFHRPSVSTVLNLPATWTPLLMVVLGHPATPPRERLPVADLDGFLYWDGYPDGGGNRRAS